MKITEAVQRFYTRCRAQGLSENTVKTYGYIYNRFVAFCLANKIEEIEKITADNIRTYFVRCQGAGYSAYTMGDIHRTLSVFFNFALGDGIILSNPMRSVKRPKISKTEHARTFTAEECDMILNHFDKSTFTGMRNYTIMCVLLGTGIRKAELLNLKVRDIDFELRTISVIGKGNKQRLVPLSYSLIRILRSYINKYHITQHLFITTMETPLSNSGLNTVFEKLKKELPISSNRLSCHTFRHTFAKSFLQNGGNLFALQSILGHEELATTRIYVDFGILGNRSQMDNFSPLENFTWKKI